MTDVEIAKQIISSNIYMTVASASRDGQPWISPVFFAYDAQYNFYWVSNKNARHSQLIQENPRVAIVIFDSTLPEGDGDAVYVEATAEELSDEPVIRHAIQVLGKRVTKDEFRVKDLQAVTGDSLWRMYKATPKIVSKLAESKQVHGQSIDWRVEISLFD